MPSRAAVQTLEKRVLKVVQTEKPYNLSDMIQISNEPFQMVIRSPEEIAAMVQKHGPDRHS